MILKYALTALVAALSVQAQAATITLTGPQSVALGDTFQLNVHVQQPFDGDRAGDELLAFGMDVLLFDRATRALDWAGVALSLAGIFIGSLRAGARPAATPAPAPREDA